MFRFFARHSFLSFLILLIPTVVSFFFLDQIKSDPSFDRLLIKNDPEKITYERVTDEFGDDNSILVYFEGPEVLKRENLLKIRQFVWDAEEVDEVQKVDSLFTTPHFVGEDGLLTTTAALEDIPNKQSDIDHIIESVVKNPLIATRLIAVDKSAIVINIQLDSSKRSLKDLALIFDDKLKRIDPEVTQKFHTGSPSIDLFIFGEMINSQKTLLPIVVFAIAFFVLIGSRSLHSAIIPVVVVLIGIIWTGAFMALMDIPVQLLVSCIPAITFILATTEIVHIMTAYIERLSLGEDKKIAIQNAMDEVGLPISLTAFTTVLGFGAIFFNKIIMLREFGLVCAFALAVSFIITILYTPLHIRLFVKSPRVKKGTETELHFFKVLSLKVFGIRKHKKLVLLMLIPYIGITSYFASHVVADNDSINLIKRSAEPRQNLNIFEKHFGGINSVFLVLELKEKSFKETQYLDLLFNLEREINNFDEFYDAESFGGLMAHINNQMITSVSGQDEYKTPKTRQLVSQYLLSLTRDDYEKYISADFKRANLTIRHSISSSSKQKIAIDKLKTYLNKKLNGLPISYKVTARSILNQRAGDTIIKAQTSSIIFMVVIIFILMSFLFKDFRMGLAAIPPNLLPILGLFGAMGILGIPLNIGSCIVAAVTVGIAVDDTIHFFTRFRGNLSRLKNSDEAIRQTLEEETAPIIITSFSLAIGFSLLMISKMVPLNQFGLLSAIVIILAMVADLVITPAVMSYIGHLLTDRKTQD